MSHFESFSVQKCAYDGAEVFVESCIHVEAMSPVHAAELALGQVLKINGKIEEARAKVWRLGADFAPVSILLYEAEKAA